MIKNTPPTQVPLDSMGDRRITLEHLRAFAAVADTKSFQAAGLRLGRTQSAITQGIKHLEDCLHCRLLERRQGSVIGLTSEGERVLPDALDIIKRVDQLVRSVQRPELKGHIRFGIPPSIGTAELQNALSSCMAVNKGLRVWVISETSLHLAAMLENGSLDAAILNESAATHNEGDLTVTHAFPDEQLVWVCNPEQLIDRDEEEVPLIAFSDGSPWTQAAVKALDAAGVPYYYAYVSTSFESVCSAVDAGIGFTALPESNVPEKYVSFAGNGSLPPLPKVRTVIKARSSSKVIMEFCKLIEQLPVFAAALQKQMV